jgi:methanogenic corrinoid protein MtbC1
VSLGERERPPARQPRPTVPLSPEQRLSMPSLPRRSLPSMPPMPSMPSTPNLTWEESPVPQGPWVPPVPGPELRALQQQLLHAFLSFDTAAANRVLELALSSRSFEAICLGLLQPTLAQVREKWSRRELSTPEERFALQYARAFLFSTFHRTYERPDAPMVVVAGGPREEEEIGVLIHAAFWRRARFRVVYLGPDAEGSSLIEQVREKHPALVALHITSAQRVRTLSRFAKDFSRIEAPRPFFAFTGPVFVRNPELKKKVSGVYLGDDPWQATWHLKHLLIGGEEPMATASRARYSQPTLGS